MPGNAEAALTYDGYNAEDLATACRVPRVELLGQTTSTLDVAHQLAADGAPAGTLVVADSQSAGRGRLGHHQRGEEGAGYEIARGEDLTSS